MWRTFLNSAAPDEFPELSQPIVPANENDFIDAFRAFESLKRVSNDRLVRQQREELVEAHALAAAGGDDDRG